MSYGGEYYLLLSGDFGELFDCGCLIGVEKGKRTFETRTSKRFQSVFRSVTEVTFFLCYYDKMVGSFRISVL